MTDLSAESERTAMLVGLANMSEACEPPVLTPSCPFYQITMSGPMCGEECMDIIAKHGGDPRPRHAIGFGDGFEVFRRAHPRPRRNRSGPDSPFDAAQVQSLDEATVTQSKRTTSLLRDLQDDLTTPAFLSDDPEDRAYRLRTSWAELERRGVPIRAIFAEVFALPVVVFLLVITNVSDALEERAADQEFAAWCQLFESLGLGSAQIRIGPNGFDGVDAGPLMRLVDWLAWADLEVIVGTRAPSPDELQPNRDPASRPGGEQRPVARWIYDRFAVTYLHDWHPQSRALEWQYLHGERPGCCSAAHMAERYVTQAELERFLADEGAASLTQNLGEGAPRTGISAAQFARPAAEHLRAGKVDLAIEMFRAIASLNPSDPDAQNNLGFCLIPRDLVEAAEHLEMANRLRSRPDATNMVNRALVYHLAGQNTEALRLLRESTKVKAGGAWLWHHDCGGGAPDDLTLGELESVSEYARELEEHIEAVGL